MQSYLLIGGSGFIGRHIAELLAQNKETKITIADRKPLTSRVGKSAAIQHIDTAAGPPTQELLEAIRQAQVIVYLASTTIPSTSNENPIYDIESNLTPLVACLEELKGHKNKKLVYASSGGTIYGPNSLLQQAEDSPTNPICSYGIVKLAAEKYLQMYFALYGVDTISLRIANPYGIEQLARTQQGAIGVFISKILRQETIEIWGDGSVARDYIWIDDVATAFLKATSYQSGSRCFNIGTGRATTLREIIQLLEHSLKRKANVEYRNTRNLDVARSALNCQLAQKELHWTPETSLEIGIQKMCEQALALYTSESSQTSRS